MRMLTGLIALLIAGCATTSGGDAPPEEIGALTPADGYTHYLAGVVHQRNGRFEKAEVHFRKAAKALPNSSSLQVQLTRFYILKQDFDAAAESCQRALELEPGNAVLWLWLGQIQDQRGLYDESADAYQKVTELRPDNVEVYRQLIEAERVSNDLVAVIDVCERLIELKPDMAPLHLQLGVTLARINDAAGAQAALVRALELQPDLEQARYILGILYLDQNEDELAADQFRTILETTPDNSRAREYLAGTLARAGHIEDAANEIARILKGPDVEPRHYLQLMYLRCAAQQFAEAADIVPPDAAPIFGTLFRAAARKGQGEPFYPLIESLDETESNVDVECQEYLNDMLYLFGQDRSGPVYIDMLRGFRQEGLKSRTVDLILGRVFIGLDQLDNAEEVLLEALDVHGPDKWTHFYLATIYEERDQFRKAEKHLKASIAIDPEDPEILNFLGYMYAEQDTKLNEAERLLKRALEIEPENGFYLDSLGWVYYQRDDPERAIELIRRAIVVMDNDDAILRDHLGDAYLRAGDKERAVKEWRRAIRLDPNLEGVREKIRRYEKN